jgi:hypothetical protein
MRVLQLFVKSVNVSSEGSTAGKICKHINFPFHCSYTTAGILITAWLGIPYKIKRADCTPPRAGAFIFLEAMFRY